MFLPMVQTPPGTLWEEPMATMALCHSISCGIGGILTTEILGIQLEHPLKITPHNGGHLQWCKGYITTPKGHIEVAWKCQKDRYQLRARIPKNTTAEVVFPPEAKAVWQSASSMTQWQETITIRDNAMIVIEPGKVGIY
jgi:hypothetical protein